MPFATNGIAPPAFSFKNINLCIMEGQHDESFNSYIREWF